MQTQCDVCNRFFDHEYSSEIVCSTCGSRYVDFDSQGHVLALTQAQAECLMRHVTEWRSVSDAFDTITKMGAL